MLHGGAGEDLFMFDTGRDVDKIRDFDAVGCRHEVLDLSDLRSVKTWRDLRDSHVEQDGAEVVIDGRRGDRVILKGGRSGRSRQGRFHF